MNSIKNKALLKNKDLFCNFKLSVIILLITVVKKHTDHALRFHALTLHTTIPQTEVLFKIKDFRFKGDDKMFYNSRKIWRKCEQRKIKVLSP